MNALTMAVALIQSRPVRSLDLCPFGQRKSSTVIGNFDRVHTIIHLLKSGRPSAILRRVITVAIDSIDRLSRRTLAHVGKEILKYVPALTHIDPTSSVARIFLVANIIAASPHRIPASIGTGAASPLTVPVSGVGNSNEIVSLASARCRASVFQCTNRYLRKGSTFTKAFPNGRFRFSCGVTDTPNSSEKIEGLACDIERNEFSHRPDYNRSKQVAGIA